MIFLYFITIYNKNYIYFFLYYFLYFFYIILNKKKYLTKYNLKFYY